MQNRAIWLLALATVAASTGASALVVLALAAPARTTPAATPGGGALVRELAALRSFLEDREGTQLQPPESAREARRLEGASSPTVAAGDVARLIGAIEHMETSLRDELATLRLALAEDADANLAARDYREGIDWEAWNEIWGVYQGDELAARGRVRLLTTDQLLARFGPPTEVSVRQNGYRMWYYFEPEGNGPLNVQIQIIDGYVSNMWMELAG